MSMSQGELVRLSPSRLIQIIVVVLLVALSLLLLLFVPVSVCGGKCVQ